MSDLRVVLRPATRDDLAAIVAIEREAFSDPWSERSFADLLRNPGVVCEVVEEATEGYAPSVLGFAVAYLAGGEGDLANIAIASAARRRGLGERLLSHVLGIARDRGTGVIFLEVRESNVAARSMYQASGFVEVGRRSKYYVRPVEDALILRRDLG